MKEAIATFGAGCFWGVEQAFSKIAGVVQTAVGYAGGEKENPSYEDVCFGTTGHAEVVRIIYDADLVSYGALLDAFWQMHDPTQGNRQGLDVGSQYRSAIMYHSEEQKLEAEKSKKGQVGRQRGEITTSIEPAGKFWRAEDYHQHYFVKSRK